MVASLTLLTALALAAPLPPGAAAAVPHAGPTLATEDTMRTEVAPILVRAPRVTLDEILERVARGEARRDSLMSDQSYLMTVRLVRNGDAKHPTELMLERVTRVFKKRPGLVRTQLLRDFVAHRKDKARAEVRIESGDEGTMDEEIVNFAFRPESRRDFRFRILGRDLVGNHVIYRIGFEPRSLLDPLMPHGMVWIDTNDFVIVRQEIGFDHSPAAPILEDVSSMVMERTNVDDHWVLQRILLRAKASFPLGRLGRSFDFSLRFDDYAINTGLPDSLFATRPRSKS